MKKRAVSSLLAVLAAVSFTLPALATETAGNDEMPEEPAAEPSAAPVDEPAAESEPDSFVLLDGVPQFLEYEVRKGTTYVTVSSFVAMADPQATVEEEDGVVTVSSSRTGYVVDAEGNAANMVLETLDMTVSTQLPYIDVNGRCIYVKGSITTVNGQVAAPIRKLAKLFNLDVSYDAAAKKALLTHAPGCGAYIQSGDSYYDADSLYWLSHIIYAESGNQPLEGMIAVGNVVMHRVNDPQFPDNIYDVLFQRNQFTPAGNGNINMTPNDQSVVAAKLVMEGVEVVPNALFFAQAGLVWFASTSRPHVATIGAHEFFA